jgi:sister chromatid cohesion protein DCC1
MIAPSYLLQILQVVLNHIDLCGHSYDRVPISTTTSSLQENHAMRKEVVEAVLLTWFGKVKKDEGSSSEEVVKIETDAIVRFMGLQVLETRAKSKLDSLDDFMSAWQAAVGPNLSDQIDVQILKVSLKQGNI